MLLLSLSFYRIFTLSCVCVAFIFSLACLYSLMTVDINIKAGSLLAFADKDCRSLLTSAPNIIFLVILSLSLVESFYCIFDFVICLCYLYLYPLASPLFARECSRYNEVDLF